MRNTFRAGWVLGQIAFLATATAAQATTLSLKAVKKNPKCTAPAPKVGQECFTDRQCDTWTSPPSFDGVCGGNITPTSMVDAQVGDKIVAEIFASDWSPEGQKARTWQVTFDMNSFFSGSSGSIVPVGWNRPPSVIACRRNSDCPPEWPICYSNGGYCAGPGHSPEKSVVVDYYRSNYIFLGEVQIGPAIDYAQYRLGSMLFNPSDAPVYAGVPKYCGTLALEVRSWGGTFTITLDDELLPPDVWPSFIKDPSNEAILPLVVQPLIIHVGHDDDFCEILQSNPPNCAIDARQPSRPDGAAKSGWSAIELSVLGDSCSSLTLADFEVEGCSLRIDHLEFEGSRVRLVFDHRICLGEWVCMSFLRTGQRWCIAHMPGDVNNDRWAGPVDCLKVIDNLNGQIHPSYPLWQCDLDRSGMCTPADILRCIDLLNGADAYDPWLGRSIPQCPSHWSRPGRV